MHESRTHPRLSTPPALPPTGSRRSMPAPAPPSARERDLRLALRTGPFSAALHLAMEAGDWTLEGLQQALARQGVEVSLSTLSYWRRGRSRPERPDSLRAVAVIEALLGLPEQTLAGLLQSRRIDPPFTVASLSRLWARPAELSELVERIMSAAGDDLTRLSICDDYYVGADRRSYRLVTRLVVRADADQVGRCLVGHWTEDGDQPATITRTSGCRPGRIRGDAATGFMVAELLLDRALRHGEYGVLEFEVAVPAQAVEPHDFSHRFVTPARLYALSVHFDPAALPARVVGFQRLSENGPDRWREELWPMGRTVHTVATDVRPGIVGIRWEWG